MPELPPVPWHCGQAAVGEEGNNLCFRCHEKAEFNLDKKPVSIWRCCVENVPAAITHTRPMPTTC